MFNLLRDLCKSADLDYRLRLSGLQTLLAPSNDALEVITPADPDAFLNAHLLSGGFESFDLRRCKTVRTLAGATLPVEMSGGTIRIGGSTLIRSDIPCTNGVLHVIDRVLSR